MDGDGEPGSSATPGPGTGSTTGPAPATPAEVKAVEDELLGIVVDGPEAGGLGRQATHTTGAAPSSSPRPPTADDVAAYVGLVELSQPTPPLPGIGPVGSTLRLGRLLVASGLMGLFGVFLLLAVLASRPGGKDPGDGSTTGAGGPAAPAQQGDVAPPAVDDAQLGAGGADAQQGGEAGIVPASCKVPISGYQVELRDLDWTVELASSSPAGAGGSGDVAAGWDTGVRNLGSEPIAIFRHFSSHATREGAPNWKPIFPRMKESEADPTVRDEFMDPLAVEGILPDQMATLSCP